MSSVRGQNIAAAHRSPEVENKMAWCPERKDERVLQGKKEKKKRSGKRKKATVAVREGRGEEPLRGEKSVSDYHQKMGEGDSGREE